MWKQFRFCCVSLLAWVAIQPPCVEVAFNKGSAGAVVNTINNNCINDIVGVQTNLTNCESDRKNKTGELTKINDTNSDLLRQIDGKNSEIDGMRRRARDDNSTILNLQALHLNCSVQLLAKMNETSSFDYQLLMDTFGAYRTRMGAEMQQKEKEIQELKDKLKEEEERLKGVVKILEDKIDALENLKLIQKDNDLILGQQANEIRELKHNLNETNFKADCLKNDLEANFELVGNLNIKIGEMEDKLEISEDRIKALLGQNDTKNCLKNELEECLESRADLNLFLGECQVLVNQTRDQNLNLTRELGEQILVSSCLKTDLEKCDETKGDLKLELKEVKAEMEEREKKFKCMETGAEMEELEKKLKCMEKEAEDRLRQIEVLKEELGNAEFAMEALNNSFSLMTSKVNSCLRSTGELVLWDLGEDRVVMNSVTCAGDESELKCPYGKNIKIMDVNYGHSKGYACSVEQIGSTSSCTISDDDVGRKIRNMCPIGSTECSINAPLEGFEEIQCNEAGGNNWDIYYACTE